MTLSKAEWRAVRPDKLRNLDAAKLMEALRRRPGQSVGDWHDVMEKCDELEFVLNRTPRMLLKSMTKDFAAALKVWHGDIADLRKAGKAALQDLGLEHIDTACTKIAEAAAVPARALLDEVQARLAAERRRPLEDRDKREHERLSGELGRHYETIRSLRRRRMKTELKADRLAQDMLRAKEVRLGRFKPTCDAMLKDLQRALSDALRDYDKHMKPPKKPKGAEAE